MDYLPIFTNIRNQHCIIVGGGAVAARKADLFIKSHAKVTVISPELKQEMKHHLERGLIFWRKEIFSEELMNTLETPKLVISATDFQEVNIAVYEYCQKQGIPVNVADQTEYCDFILPGIVERGPITVAVSTGGRSPVLARLMKSQLETKIPHGYGKVGEILGEYRNEVKQRIVEPNGRKLFWEELLSGVFLDKAVQGKVDEARNILETKLEQDSRTDYAPKGEVYLIGAGPGDPELMTFKALRLLQQADVVVYDRLVSPEILDMARREAERIYVGKKDRWHRVPQPRINELLVELAKEGKKVARLKGGDPYIFGRGAEEAELLADNDISFQVVPGITAAAGCAASCDFPLTHRDYSSSVSLVTGHQQAGSSEIDYARLAKCGDTMVFYMGIKNAKAIQKGLIEHGINPKIPAAIIENGTRANQKITVIPLDELGATIEIQKIQPPSLLVIGEVLNVRKKLTLKSNRNEIDELVTEAYQVAV